jgi:hypothetical protein
MFYKCRLNFRQTGMIFGQNAMKITNLEGEPGFPKGSIPVDVLRRLGVNSVMRCPMQTGKRAAVRTKEIESKTNVVASVEFVVRAALHDSIEDDFVHSIAGRIIAETENRGEEDAGQISASLVQFGESLDHGISAERLGDGISGDILEYWEHLFDVETGYPKEEIQNEFKVVDLDLLIIDYVAIYPEYRGLRIAESAIHRTIDIFGTGCGLAACKPWPLQFTPSVANDQEVLKRLALPNVSKGEAIRKLRSYWSRLGFWPLGNTGIYLLSLSQRGCRTSCQDSAKSLNNSDSRSPLRPVRTLPCHRSVGMPQFPIACNARDFPI